MRETNFTLGPIQKSLYLLLLYQFTFAQNRPKSDISGALGPIHYITLKTFAMALGDGTKCKTCFGGVYVTKWKRFQHMLKQIVPTHKKRVKFQH